MSLRLVTIVGSLRQGSYNRMIANSLQDLAPAGVSITLAPSIAGIPLYDSDLQAKGFPETVTALAHAIEGADGVIVVTPEYNYSVPGVLKNAIDWLSRLSPQPLAGKPLVIQSASMGVMGGVRAQYHLRQILVFLDALVLNKPEVMVGAAQTKVDADKGILTDEPTRQFIAGQLEAFAAFVRKAE